MNGSAGRNFRNARHRHRRARKASASPCRGPGRRGLPGVALVGRSQEKARQGRASLKKSGVDAIFISADVAKVADCKRAVATAISHFGPSMRWSIAATSARGSLVETSEDVFDQIFNTNVRAPSSSCKGLWRICWGARRRVRSSTCCRCRRMRPVVPRTLFVEQGCADGR